MAKNGTTSIIVGFGEIGRGLYKIVGGDYFDLSGAKEINSYKYDVIHICFPYSDMFSRNVRLYQQLLKTKDSLTIVHSTVPVGTCDALGVVHSPVRGVHPNIDKGIKTFVKYVGGKNAKQAAEYLGRFGVKTYICKHAKETEALKLWDTTQYGIMILLNKEIHNWCEKNGIDFGVVYTHANMTYNAGYTKLGRHEVVRPYLKYMKGKIGGHCVVPNSKLLKSFSPFLIKLCNRILG